MGKWTGKEKLALDLVLLNDVDLRDAKLTRDDLYTALGASKED